MKTKNVPREKIPWFPAVDADKCTGCDICADFCPHGVYEKGVDSPVVIVRNPYACVVGCNNCENRCPEKAISFPDLEVISEVIRRLREDA
ncbi:MAG: 4Fe-4S binding protein [Candidatus Aminicenantes bacterium]|nr:4Fe-4S binding protein [Candidatus Aminicenantes bacterium]